MLSYYVSFAHFDQCSLILSLIECISFKEMVTGTVQTNPYRPLQWNRMMDNGRICYIVIIASFHFLIYFFFFSIAAILERFSTIIPQLNF